MMILLHIEVYPSFTVKFKMGFSDPVQITRSWPGHWQMFYLLSRHAIYRGSIVVL